MKFLDLDSRYACSRQRGGGGGGCICASERERERESSQQFGRLNRSYLWIGSITSKFVRESLKCTSFHYSDIIVSKKGRNY